MESGSSQGNCIWNCFEPAVILLYGHSEARFFARGLGMSTQETLEQFWSCWEGLKDPGSGNAGLYDFDELLVIALCAVLCGGQGAVEMALFAKAKEPFLRGFLKLKNGLPRHDTFSSVWQS
jgi:DDE_Tnp_1-associated